ncbi:MAG TPA: hypothetical protein VFW65_39755 [Pseudonocardiaceae bacterium]|nr:hypothetical protein [Pseudonocardiaceae bacterium]
MITVDGVFRNLLRIRPVAELLPGDPDTLDGTVQMLNSYGDMLTEAGTGLQRIDTADGWFGTAADGFHKAFQGQPGKWIEAGGCFHSAAQAVGNYATTLMR